MDIMNFLNLDTSIPGGYPPPPVILLYNFQNEERTHKIRRYLQKSGVDIREVTPVDFLHPLGYLFGLPGFEPCPRFNMGESFSDEMMVMKDFSSTQLNAFLQFFRDNGLESVALKSVLTPVTTHWNSLELHKELTAEHQAMKKD